MDIDGTLCVFCVGPGPFLAWLSVGWEVSFIAGLLRLFELIEIYCPFIQINSFAL